MKWIRKCPKCNKDIYYSDRGVLYRKSIKNRICRDCWKQQVKSARTTLVRTCPACKKIMKYKDYKNFWAANKKSQKCIACSKIGNTSRRGQKCSPDHKLKIGAAHKGKVISENTKYKMRLAAIKRMNVLGITQYRNYNPVACQYFDKLNIEKQWNLQHAKNGGEVQIYGYFIDAYDKNKNIIVEYDEPHHSRPCIKKKDLERQDRLKAHLQCDFYRYDESKKQLIKV